MKLYRNMMCTFLDGALTPIAYAYYLDEIEKKLQRAPLLVVTLWPAWGRMIGVR